MSGVTIREKKGGKIVKHTLSYNDLITADDMRAMKEIEDKYPTLLDIIGTDKASEYFGYIFTDDISKIDLNKCPIRDLSAAVTGFFPAVLTPSNT